MALTEDHGIPSGDQPATQEVGTDSPTGLKSQAQLSPSGGPLGISMRVLFGGQYAFPLSRVLAVLSFSPLPSF